LVKIVKQGPVWYVVSGSRGFALFDDLHDVMRVNLPAAYPGDVIDQDGAVLLVKLGIYFISKNPSSAGRKAPVENHGQFSTAENCFNQFGRRPGQERPSVRHRRLDREKPGCISRP